MSPLIVQPFLNPGDLELLDTAGNGSVRQVRGMLAVVGKDSQSVISGLMCTVSSDVTSRRPKLWNAAMQVQDGSAVNYVSLTHINNIFVKLNLYLVSLQHINMFYIALHAIMYIVKYSIANLKGHNTQQSGHTDQNCSK